MKMNQMCLILCLIVSVFTIIIVVPLSIVIAQFAYCICHFFINAVGFCEFTYFDSLVHSHIKPELN
jgi:hypothetical protein